MLSQLSNLMEHNKRWANRTEASRPGFFQSLLAQQAPEYLWIGCADSRVPANELVGLQPGELFVHRNIANVVSHSDLNCLSCIQYAVDVLRVRHIIVVGHSRCGGVLAALEQSRIGVADNWILHVREVIDRHEDLLGRVRTLARVDVACELNVLAQARNVCKSTTVQDAWARGQSLAVHGWVYGLHDGLLKATGFEVENAQEVDQVYVRSVDKMYACHVG
jgi:carbonic anhydrase